MNKKQKRLTLDALAVFGLIIFFHYCDPWFHQGQLSFGVGGAWHGGRYHAGSIEPLIADVRMPLFALAVIYAGLFFLFGGTDAAPVPRRPRNWRRIIGLILALLLVAGGIAGIIYSQEEQRRIQEEERRSEQSRRDAIEVEDSKHRIKPSEIRLKDLKLDNRYGGFGSYNVTGRVTNDSKYNLTAVVLKITLTDNYPDKSLEIIGQESVTFTVTVPPYQTRDIGQTVYFDHLPKPVGKYGFVYYISEIRGTKCADWFEANAPSAAKYLGLTPTPSPKRDKDHPLLPWEMAWSTANPSGLTPTPSPKRGIYDDLVEEAKAKKKHGPDAAPTP